MFSHSDSVAVADTLRLVTVAELAIAAGLCCAVMGIYTLANVHISRAVAERGGALIRYVIAISLSYVLLAAFAVAEIQGYYGSVLTYRAPIGFVAANVGIYALVNMLMFQNARLDRRDHDIQVGGAPDA